MSDTTRLIDLEPIVSAPTDGRAFEAILGGAPNVLEVVRFDVGRWKVYRGLVPSPTGSKRGMTVWHVLPEGIYPTHWIKASLGNVPKQDRSPEDV